MMDLASQTQRHLTMRGFGSTHNGSQPPYHPSLGQEFSSTPNKFPSFGMVVAGDAQRVASETGPKEQQIDSGLNYGELSGPAQHVLRKFSVESTGVGLGFFGGLALIYAGLDYPFAPEVIARIKDIRLKEAGRVLAIGTGAYLVATSGGS